MVGTGGLESKVHSLPSCTLTTVGEKETKCIQKSANQSHGGMPLHNHEDSNNEKTDACSWMNLENTVLSEGSQVQMNMFSMIPFM